MTLDCRYVIYLRIRNESEQIKVENMIEISYLSFLVPSIAARAMIELIAMSTGITWAVREPSQSIVRMTPLPAPNMTPTGPFRLSTQPGTGSFSEGHTGEKNL